MPEEDLYYSLGVYLAIILGTLLFVVVIHISCYCCKVKPDTIKLEEKMKKISSEDIDKFTDKDFPLQLAVGSRWKWLCGFMPKTHHHHLILGHKLKQNLAAAAESDGIPHFCVLEYGQQWFPSDFAHLLGGTIQRNVKSAEKLKEYADQGRLFQVHYSMTDDQREEARNRLKVIGRTNRSWRPFYDNCHHIATFVMTGSHSCAQLSESSFGKHFFLHGLPHILLMLNSPNLIRLLGRIAFVLLAVFLYSHNYRIWAFGSILVFHLIFYLLWEWWILWQLWRSPRKNDETKNCIECNGTYKYEPPPRSLFLVSAYQALLVTLLATVSFSLSPSIGHLYLPRSWHVYGRQSYILILFEICVWGVLYPFFAAISESVLYIYVAVRETGETKMVGQEGECDPCMLQMEQGQAHISEESVLKNGGKWEKILIFVGLLLLLIVFGVLLYGTVFAGMLSYCLRANHISESLGKHTVDCVKMLWSFEKRDDQIGY